MTSRIPLLILGSIALLLIHHGNAVTLECPKAPEQVSKDVEREVNASVAKIGSVTGGELKAKTRKITQDLLGKLPDAGRIYLEQMMFAAYCSALRDDKTISETEKARRLKEYIHEVRGTITATPGPASEKTTPPAPALASISITPADVTLQVGVAQWFTAVGTYSNGKNQDLTKQVTWKSSNKAVATVEGGGLAKAVGAGAATITATLGTISGDTTFNVSPKPVESPRGVRVIR